MIHREEISLKKSKFFASVFPKFRKYTTQIYFGENAGTHGRIWPFGSIGTLGHDSLISDEEEPMLASCFVPVREFL